MAPTGKINDPKVIKKVIEMEGLKQSNDISTKNKVSVEYLKQLIDTKEMSEARQKLLLLFIEKKVDHRTLLKMKQDIFDKFSTSTEITVDEWKAE